MTNTFSRILNIAVFSGLFFLCMAFVAIRLSGVSTFIVTGASMEPTMHKGSLALVQPVSPSDVRVGDVITFQQYDQTTTHRVTRISQTPQGLAFSTKGDGNVVADPEPKVFAGQVGTLRFALPVAGYAVAYLQAYWRLALSVVAAIVFFACAGLLVFRKDEVAAAAPAPRRHAAARAVPVSVDTDETWNAHLAWLRRSAQRQTQVA